MTQENGNDVVQGEVMQESRAIVPTLPRERASVLLAPVMDVNIAKQRLAEFQEFVQSYLKEGEDFGIIPGTIKPTLYKPGADKLCELYGLYDDYVITSKVEDFSAEPPLFDYTVKCILRSRRDDSMVSTGFGSCNSYEGKYKWRDNKRKCPQCGKETIIKGKAEYSRGQVGYEDGGWLCWAKLGKSDGCGAKFPDADPSITEQVVGRTVNDDIATIKNTILKMAMKRSKIGTTLAATRSSGVFTQDMEDITPPNGEPEVQGSTAAQQAVANAKIADYRERTANQVKDQTVEYYPTELKGEEFIAFIPGPALSVLLENGLATVTTYSNTLKARIMPDDSESIKILDKVAAELKVKLKRLPQGRPGATPVTQAPTAKEPTIVSAATKTKGEKTWLEVMYGNTAWSKKFYCWDKDLFPYIKEGIGKTAELITKPSSNPKYTDLVGLTRIGDQTFSEIDGKYRPDIQRLPYQATDDDVSVLR